jgi:hypothetical protein
MMVFCDGEARGAETTSDSNKLTGVRVTFQDTSRDVAFGLRKVSRTIHFLLTMV